MNHCFDRNEFDMFICVYSENFKSHLPSELTSSFQEHIGMMLSKGKNRKQANSQATLYENEWITFLSKAIAKKKILMLFDGFNLHLNDAKSKAVSTFIHDLSTQPSKKLRIIVTSRVLPASTQFPPVR
jgi:hypothetical protein